MNEIIKELESKCWEPRANPVAQTSLGDKFNIAKFADLILEEVMQTLIIEGQEQAVDILNEHFGVE